jgi:hypothetical protein
LKRTPQNRLARIFVLLLLAGVLTSCSSSTINTSTVPTGQLITIVRDAPICNAITAAVVLQNLNFSETQGGVFVPYMNTTASFAPEIRMNLQQLRDFNTILYAGSVKAGSFNQANLDFELGHLAAYDPLLSPPVHNYVVTFTNSRPFVTINPPLVITAGQVNVMVLDFDVRRMLGTDASGNLTGVINPVASITQLSATDPSGAVKPDGFGEVDDLWGFVRSISNTNTSSNPTYKGSFQMQVLSPSTAQAPQVQ